MSLLPGIEDSMLIVLANGTLFLIFMVFLFFAKKWFWIGFALHILRHSLIVRIYNDSSISFDTAKNPSKIEYNDDKGNVTNLAEVTRIFHFGRDSGKPIHITKESDSKNINLSDEEYSKDAELHSSSNIMTYAQGVLEGQKGLANKLPNWFIGAIVLIGILLAANIYLSYNTTQAMTEVKTEASSISAKIETAIDEFEQTGGTVTIKPGKKPINPEDEENE